MKIKYSIDPKSESLKDFVRFGTAMIVSGDIDPQFWIMRDYYEKNKFSVNKQLWLSAVYLVYYHLGSASIAWDLYKEPDVIKKKNWNTELFYFKQRRCFRGNTHALNQLNTLVKLTDGDLQAWIESLVGDGGKAGWARVREAYASLPYIGPWASYKWCDIVKFVHRYPITGPDIGNKPGETAGPIAGLSTLTGLSRDECANNSAIYQHLYRVVKNEMGMPLIGLDHLESCLCDWQSITNGRYYHGHDIDRDLAQLLYYDFNSISLKLLDARERIFDTRYLGEQQNFFSDWYKPRGDMKTIYRNRKEIVNVYKDAKEVTLL